MNLLDNALRVTPGGGEVVGGASGGGDGMEVELWVSDTGPGISPEDRARLFDRFWQVSRKDKGGAGLGLSIVEGIVEAHGGRVWVDTEEGGGSTFRVVVPPGPEDS
jgi:signal transduction histidine kinase